MYRYYRINAILSVEWGVPISPIVLLLQSRPDICDSVFQDMMRSVFDQILRLVNDRPSVDVAAAAAYEQSSSSSKEVAHPGTPTDTLSVEVNWNYLQCLSTLTLHDFTGFYFDMFSWAMVMRVLMVAYFYVSIKILIYQVVHSHSCF